MRKESIVRCWLPAAALSLVLSGLAPAATFELLDTPEAAPWTRCTLSRDGQVLAVNAGGRYFLWTRSQSLVEIGTGHPLATDLGIAGDGAAVCGTVVDRGGRRLPAIWRADTGWAPVVAVADPGEGNANLGSAYGLSGDGDVAVGLVWDGSRAVAFRWSAAAGLARLQDSGRGSRASAVSADGRIVVGFDEHPRHGLRRPARWVDGHLELLAGPEARGEILAVTDAGDRCCGQHEGRAFSHGGDSGLHELGVLGDDPRDSSRATGISDAGLVAGWSGNPSLGRREAFVWTAEAGMHALTAWLARLDVAVPDSLVLTEVQAVSGDGTTLAGTWQDQRWRQGIWLITGLDAESYAALTSLGPGAGNEVPQQRWSEWPPPPVRPGRPGIRR